MGTLRTLSFKPELNILFLSIIVPPDSHVLLGLMTALKLRGFDVTHVKEYLLPLGNL